MTIDDADADEYEEALRVVLKRGLGSTIPENIPTQHARALIGDFLIRASVKEIPSEGDVDFHDSMDYILLVERERRGIVPWESLPPCKSDPRLAVWQGDITRLGVGAVVNAANDAGLGCFQPSHKCIDNVIHRAAGPRLRLACARELERKSSRWGGKLPTGQVIATEAFNLPAEWVMHTPGPIGEQPELLASCYRNVLNACRKRHIRTVAFCCISTGLYGYPNDAAAKVAIRTVKEWLDEVEKAEGVEEPEWEVVPAKDAGHPFDRIIFNVFLDKDAMIYKSLLDAG
mmetsp:Transcript_95403/g.199599  ORF Transcript_95403/g.199599 Transcript_95403/m.199599 type:complete len:287 (+) Transcript_95403:196-1056(+)|eukprot:CAMPEP_0206427658 /NCGR_PEP_ID=MMETSP0324_2-20121206/5174_1 /ASSEMBLY_ACC=CAM_ASM_000836 /TAXON_ID=2866 /ORGANISM="Crypthecodinium cohnii, Strain Seligo" /LENGTH=286 /DNA_ID=CAMNT_0053892985 /DNA_START=132 /DNA_END=992 /DNA_ORIENTATION=-